MRLRLRKVKDKRIKKNKEKRYTFIKKNDKIKPLS